MTNAVDYLIVPAFLTLTVSLTALLAGSGASPTVVTTLVVGVAVGAAAVLERIRPEREDSRLLDQPLLTDAAHFLFNYNAGYLVASYLRVVVAGRLQASAIPSVWPIHWPLVLQVVTAIVITEGVSYWQHRAVHGVSRLWPFHALHHTGARLNLIRGGRFHFIDSVTAAASVLLPLVVLGAPEAIFVWTIVIYGTLGVVQHANMRVRTPWWMDRLFCTPAVHRLHHSRDPREGASNFGTTVMVFDLMFGTYLAPRGSMPASVGIENDPVPAGFWRQTFDPFRFRL